MSGEQDDSAPVVELLRLPPQEAQAILAEAGESAGKVWLALIYRLASLEAQVRDLAAELRARPAHGDSSTEVKQAVGSVNSGVERGSGSSAAPVAANFPPRARAAVDFDEGSKTEMLEKVFRKNWSLRQQDSPQG